MRMRHIVIYDLTGSAIYFHIIVNGMIFGEKNIEHKMCLDFLCKFCLKPSDMIKKCILVFM